MKTNKKPPPRKNQLTLVKEGCCPFCGSFNTDQGEMYYEKTRYLRPWCPEACRSCNKKWITTFSVIKVEEQK